MLYRGAHCHACVPNSASRAVPYSYSALSVPLHACVRCIASAGNKWEHTTCSSFIHSFIPTVSQLRDDRQHPSLASPLPAWSFHCPCCSNVCRPACKETRAPLKTMERRQEQAWKARCATTSRCGAPGCRQVASVTRYSAWLTCCLQSLSWQMQQTQNMNPG
jgi:hypothetical protein